MNRGYLALGIGLAIAAAFALFVFQKSPSPEVVTTHGATVRRNPEADPGKPALPAEAPGDAAGQEGERSGSSTDYMVGDVRIRDHRSGDHPQVDVPPTVHPPHGRQIASTVTYALSQQLAPVFKECGALAPASARGTKPRVEGQMTIAIKNHQATILSTVYEPRDLVGDSVAAVKACLEQKSVGLAAPAADEPDLETYAIALQLRLP